MAPQTTLTIKKGSWKLNYIHKPNHFLGGKKHSSLPTTPKSWRFYRKSDQSKFIASSPTALNSKPFVFINQGKITPSELILVIEDLFQQTNFITSWTNKSWSRFGFFPDGTEAIKFLAEHDDGFHSVNKNPHTQPIFTTRRIFLSGMICRL